MNINDTQIGGSHYKAGTQHWDYAIRALGNRYLEGNITKYVVRYRKKNGTQDLEKAAHYLEKLILEYGQGTVAPMVAQPNRLAFDVDGFMLDNDMDARQCRLVRVITGWRNGQDLAEARELLAQMLRASRANDARIEAIKAGAEPSSQGYVNQD